MEKVTARTRAPWKGGGGRQIVCPECGHTMTVYHFAWSALGCQGCKQMVDKYEYFIKQN